MAEGSGRRTTAIRAGVLIGVAALASLGLGSALGNDERDIGGASTTAHATLADASGTEVGHVRFRQLGGGALAVRVAVAGLTPGFHGFHVHETGACVAPFASAGGHHNPTGQVHGAHAGDMPPLLVDGDGRANVAFRTTSLTLDGLLDEGGDASAVIVHEGSDNLANIPDRYHSHAPDASSHTVGPDTETQAAGDAGARAACGVVRE